MGNRSWRVVGGRLRAWSDTAIAFWASAGALALAAGIAWFCFWLLTGPGGLSVNAYLYGVIAFAVVLISPHGGG